MMQRLKDKLPYFDRFPVVIIIETYETGFLGINFHYIPPMKSREVLDGLLRYWDGETDDIEMTYSLLKKISKLKCKTMFKELSLYTYRK